MATMVLAGHDQIGLKATTLAPRGGVYERVPDDAHEAAMADALGGGGSSSSALTGGRPVVRKYTVFPGKSKFLCDGRIMQGPDRYMLLVTLTLILVPGIVFVAVDLPWLTRQLSPAVPACFVLLLAFTVGSLCATSFRDPGVIPRQQPPPTPAPRPAPATSAAGSDDKDAPLPPHYPLAAPPLPSPSHSSSAHANMGNHAGIDHNVNAAVPPVLGVYEYHVNGHVIKTRYCPTCQMARAPRVHHCRACDACVDCPWVANCVGRRNHRSFVTFVVACTLLALYVAAFSLYHFAVVAQASPAQDASGKLTDALAEAPTSYAPA